MSAQKKRGTGHGARDTEKSAQRTRISTQPTRKHRPASSCPAPCPLPRAPHLGATR